MSRSLKFSSCYYCGRKQPTGEAYRVDPTWLTIVCRNCKLPGLAIVAPLTKRKSVNVCGQCGAISTITAERVDGGFTVETALEGEVIPIF